MKPVSGKNYIDPMKHRAVLAARSMIRVPQIVGKKKENHLQVNMKLRRKRA
jgi:hypothetical protein